MFQHKAAALSFLLLFVCPVHLLAQEISLDAMGDEGDQEARAALVGEAGGIGIQIFVTGASGANGIGIRYELRPGGQATVFNFHAPNHAWGDDVPIYTTNSGRGESDVESFLPYGEAAVFSSEGSLSTNDSVYIGELDIRTSPDFTGTTLIVTEVLLMRNGKVEVLYTLEEGMAPSFMVKLRKIPDFNDDGVVGIADFFEFALHFGTSIGDSSYDPEYDLDHSGGIDEQDFWRFSSYFGQSVITESVTGNATGN